MPHGRYIADFTLDILPIIQLGMESPTHSLMDAAMKCLPATLPVLDFSTVKNEVFPPVASAFTRTGSLSVKIRGLEAFVVLCGGSVGDVTASEDDLSGMVKDKKSKPATGSILDKYTVQEKLVPLLKAIKTKEPAVMMAALNVFREVGRIVDTDFLALEVLPILWSYSLGPLLDLQQFQQFVELIKLLSAKIEREQRKKLLELSSKDESASRGSDIQGVLGTNDVGASNVNATNNDFERLVLGKDGNPDVKSDDLWDDWRSGPSAAKAPSVVTSPTFAWSSNSAYTAHRSAVGIPNAIASPVGQTSRSITPDLSLGGYPSLEPMNKRPSIGPTAPPTQQATVSWNSALTNTQQNSQKSAFNSSLTTLGSMSAATPMSITNHTRPPPAPNYSAFTIPPPPTDYQKPQTIITHPTHASTAQLPLQNGDSNKTASQQKQGLDKYESLL
jgi:SCY1-like protein 2